MTIYKSGCSICLFLPWCCDCYQLTSCPLIFLPMNQSVFTCALHTNQHGYLAHTNTNWIPPVVSDFCWPSPGPRPLLTHSKRRPVASLIHANTPCRGALVRHQKKIFVILIKNVAKRLIDKIPFLECVKKFNKLLWVQNAGPRNILCEEIIIVSQWHKGEPSSDNSQSELSVVCSGPIRGQHLMRCHKTSQTISSQNVIVAELGSV